MEGHSRGQAGGSSPSSLNPGNGGVDHPGYPGSLLNSTFPADRSMWNVIRRYLGNLSPLTSRREREGWTNSYELSGGNFISRNKIIQP